MVYIIVLNWKGAKDTIACLSSLSNLRKVEYRIVVCDNASPDNSYQEILDEVKHMPQYRNYSIVELSRDEAETYNISTDVSIENKLYFIQTGQNLGYAGGNNVGIRFAMNQADMRYVWLLNNDTEVDPDALYYLVDRCEYNKQIGICGSRLVYYYDREHLQGLGGVYNKWWGTTHHYAAYQPSDSIFDDDTVSNEIDYVIGASMLLTRDLLDGVGLLCEDYFLYFEELDLSLRAKNVFKQSIATKSIVYHKEGGTTNDGNSKSNFADYLAIKNRVLITKKYNQKYLIFVCISLVFVFFNRIRRFQFKKSLGVISAMFNGIFR